MAFSTSSQAAAFALRELQDKLTSAHVEINKLQREKESLQQREERYVEEKQRQLEDCNACNDNLRLELSSMRDMMNEMKSALEETLSENARLAEDVKLAEVSAKRFQTEAETVHMKFESCSRALQEIRGESGKTAHELSMLVQAKQEIDDALEKEKHLTVELSRQLDGSRIAALNLEADISELKLRAEKLEHESEEWRLKYEAANAQAIAANARAEMGAACEERVKDLQDAVDCERQSRIQSENEAASAKERAAALEVEIATLRQKIESQSTALNEIKSQSMEKQSNWAENVRLRDNLGQVVKNSETTLQQVIDLNKALVDAFTRRRSPNKEEKQSNTDVMSSKTASDANNVEILQVHAQPPTTAPGVYVQYQGKQPDNPMHGNGCMGGHVMAADVQYGGTRIVSPCFDHQMMPHAVGVTECASGHNVVACSAPVGLPWQEKRERTPPVFANASSTPSDVWEDLSHASTIATILERNRKEEERASRGRSTDDNNYATSTSTDKSKPRQAERVKKSNKPPRTGTLSRQSLNRSGKSKRSVATANKKDAKKGGGVGQDCIKSVISGLEDELAALDLRYAGLLRQYESSGGSDEEDGATKRAKLAGSTACMLEAMQRKVHQIQQLKAICPQQMKD